MSEINMQKFLNTLWEFTGRKEDEDNFIQKALKVYKVFKVKPLKTPKSDVLSKKSLLIQAQMTWTMNKSLQQNSLKKHQKNRLRRLR